MHGNITVDGCYQCSSADLKYFHVSDLKTPLGTCKSSLLRSSDIISIDFEVPNLLSLEILPKLPQDCTSEVK